MLDRVGKDRVPGWTVDMPDGLLMVLSEPNPEQDISAFHRWYDDEHVPARVALPQVQTAVRLRAEDGEKPSWLAAYDLQLEVLYTPRYRRLREQRSVRERQIISGLRTLDRRVYESLEEFGAPAVGPSVVWIAVSVTIPAEHEHDLATWYREEHVPRLHAMPGWRRTRRFRLREGHAPRLLALHELDDVAPLGDPRYVAAKSTPWRTRVMADVLAHERRVFSVRHRFL